MAFQAMTGGRAPVYVNETNAYVTMAGIMIDQTVTVAPVVALVDTHDGGRHERRLKRRFDAEIAAKEARRNDLIAAYRLLVEGRPAEAAQAVEAFAPETPRGSPPAIQQVDWSALLDHVSAVERLWAAFIDMDDEDVLVMM